MTHSLPDVVLVINPSLWYKPMYPSGILYLAGYLRQQGVSCEIIDSALSSHVVPAMRRPALVAEAIAARKPRVVCFSASHTELAEVVLIHRLLKAKLGARQGISIVGGPQPTYRPEDFLNNDFDFVCIGEGEKTLCEFVGEAVRTHQNWQTVRGLVWKNAARIVRNDPRELMTESELDDLPLPAYDMIDKRYFRTNAGLIRGLPLRGAMLLTTRGCPFNCSFCGCNLIFGRTLRKKSLKSIEREIAYLKVQHQIEGVWIIDDTFTVDRAHLRGVSELLKKYDVVWGCQSRVNTIDEEMIRVMKEAGCRQIDFGVESGSQRILDEIIQKKITVDQVVKAFDLARRYHIRTLANFMIGLPTETLREFEQTKRLAERIRADVYIFSIATPLPGTKLYDMVGVPISPDDYTMLTWSGSPLTKKLNKSEIQDPTAARNSLMRRFYVRSLLKSFLSLDNIWFFLTHPFKLEKIACLFRYLGRVVR